MAVIGCLIQNEKAQAEILDRVDRSDFLSPELGELFEKLRDQWERAGRLDAVTVAALPAGQKVLAVRCCEAPIVYSAWASYIQAMLDASKGAKAQTIGLRLATGDCTAQEIQEAAGALGLLLAGREEVKRFSAPEGAAWFIRAMASGKDPALKTGFSRLDSYTAWAPGDFVVIGGRPSSGKTAFTLQLAMQMAGAGKRVVYYSYETSREKLTMRAAACDWGLDFDAVRRYTADLSRVSPLAIDRYSGRPFEIVEAAGRNAGWLKMDALAHRAQVVFIDYLGLVPGPGQTEYERATRVSKELHTMAQSTKLLVVALCQLNRAGAGGLPTMENLRESGQIEQDADNILLLHSEREGGRCTVRIAKNKDGVTGDLPFFFEGKKQRFYQREAGA